MPLYEYRCPDCDTIYHESLPIAEVSEAEFTCPVCPDAPDLIRRFGFNYKPDMPAHFNNAAGKFVRNEKHLKDEFKYMSEAYSNRTGLPAAFEPLDSREVAGLNLDGLDSTFERTNQRNTAEIERIIDGSPKPTSKAKAIRKPTKITGGWETYSK